MRAAKKGLKEKSGVTERCHCQVKQKARLLKNIPAENPTLDLPRFR
jgi:hypothetical protein